VNHPAPQGAITRRLVRHIGREKMKVIIESNIKKAVRDWDGRITGGAVPADAWV